MKLGGKKYKIKATIDGKKIGGEYTIKDLLKELEDVIKWQEKRKR